MKKKNPLAMFVAIVLAAIVALGCACTPTPDQDKDDDNGVVTQTESILDNGILKVNGTLVKNSKGDEVVLRGTNVGGLLVTENWMSGFTYDTADYLSINRALIERFGKEETKELWANYQSNFFSEEDIKLCAEMGMTVLRLPFSYMNVDFDAIGDYDAAGENYDFSALDNFVATAAKYNIYTILDLHGAYGSQNGQDHSGQVISNQSDVDFYSNEKYISLTVKLWGALAEHFKDNPAVAGYDILNEPGEKACNTEERHFVVFDKIYDEIRKYDTEHMVIFESCWTGENLPQPSEYGWTNCIYEFHHYTGETSNVSAHIASMSARVQNILEQDFGVPIFMGEFTCYGQRESWDYTLSLFDSYGIHWTTWTYKVNISSPWGIFNSSATRSNVEEDDKETILANFADTSTEKCVKSTLSDGSTLFDVLKNHCFSVNSADTLPSGEYLLFDMDTGNAMNYKKLSDDESCKLYLDKNVGASITVVADDEGNCSIKLGSLNMCVFDWGGQICAGAQKSADVAGEAYIFQLIKYNDGIVVRSAYTGAYLRYDENTEMFVADASEENATVFDWEEA